jgi:hypothetical protein
MLVGSMYLINEKLNSGKPRLVDGELHFRYYS